MKYIRMAGLLAIAASAVMSFAATASAVTLTSPTGTVYTGTITAESEGATSIHGSFVTVSCKKSHVQSKVESHGGGVTATGSNSILSFAECNFPVKVLTTLVAVPFGTSIRNYHGLVTASSAARPALGQAHTG